MNDPVFVFLKMLRNGLQNRTPKKNALRINMRIVWNLIDSSSCYQIVYTTWTQLFKTSSGRFMLLRANIIQINRAGERVWRLNYNFSLAERPWVFYLILYRSFMLDWKRHSNTMRVVLLFHAPWAVWSLRWYRLPRFTWWTRSLLHVEDLGCRHLVWRHRRSSVHHPG